MRITNKSRSSFIVKYFNGKNLIKRNKVTVSHGPILIGNTNRVITISLIIYWKLCEVSRYLDDRVILKTV